MVYVKNNPCGYIFFAFNNLNVVLAIPPCPPMVLRVFITLLPHTISALFQPLEVYENAMNYLKKN